MTSPGWYVVGFVAGESFVGGGSVGVDNFLANVNQGHGLRDFGGLLGWGSVCVF